MKTNKRIIISLMLFILSNNSMNLSMNQTASKSSIAKTKTLAAIGLGAAGYYGWKEYSQWTDPEQPSQAVQNWVRKTLKKQNLDPDIVDRLQIKPGDFACHWITDKLFVPITHAELRKAQLQEIKFQTEQLVKKSSYMLGDTSWDPIADMRAYALTSNLDLYRGSLAHEQKHLDEKNINFLNFFKIILGSTKEEERKKIQNILTDYKKSGKINRTILELPDELKKLTYDMIAIKKFKRCRDLDITDFKTLQAPLRQEIEAIINEEISCDEHMLTVHQNNPKVLWAMAQYFYKSDKRMIGHMLSNDFVLNYLNFRSKNDTVSRFGSNVLKRYKSTFESQMDSEKLPQSYKVESRINLPHPPPITRCNKAIIAARNAEKEYATKMKQGCTIV